MYASQIGSPVEEKQEFWKQLQDEVGCVPGAEAKYGIMMWWVVMVVETEMKNEQQCWIPVKIMS